MYFSVKYVIESMKYRKVVRVQNIEENKNKIIELLSNNKPEEILVLVDQDSELKKELTEKFNVVFPITQFKEFMKLLKIKKPRD